MENNAFVGCSLQLYPETIDAIASTDSQCIVLEIMTSKSIWLIYSPFKLMTETRKAVIVTDIHLTFTENQGMSSWYIHRKFMQRQNGFYRNWKYICIGQTDILLIFFRTLSPN